MKRMRNAAKSPCYGSRIAAKPDGIPTVDPNTIDRIEMAGTCTVCWARVGIYQNESDVWVPKPHPSK